MDQAMGDSQVRGFPLTVIVFTDLRLGATRRYAQDVGRRTCFKCAITGSER